MKQAGEAREQAENNSRGRGNDRGDRGRDDRSDRGEDMRKVWEDRMKQWRQMRERGHNDARQSPQSRGPQPNPRGSSAQRDEPQWGRGGFRGPGAGRRPQRGDPLAHHRKIVGHKDRIGADPADDKLI